jgi:ubiquinone/menaquinone biosynthesis C-methylase UbiE
MKKDRELLESKLSEYMRVDNLLELGCFNGSELGCYTQMLSKYAKNVTAVDIDNQNVESAKEIYNSKNIDNINVIQMNAAKLKFEDNSFNCVVSSSFHEMDPLIQLDILKEADRVLKHPKRFIFMEPHEDSVTNRLFRVFDPNEDHAQRILNTKETIINFAKEYNYKIEKLTDTLAVNQFDSKEELLNEMLNWWSDIYIPQGEEEKERMTNDIENILQTYSSEYYTNNQVNEFIWNWVLEKE